MAPKVGVDPNRFPCHPLSRRWYAPAYIIRHIWARFELSLLLKKTVSLKSELCLWGLSAAIEEFLSRLYGVCLW